MGGEVIADSAHDPGEFAAGELHAVARIADKANHHRVEFEVLWLGVRRLYGRSRRGSRDVHGSNETTVQFGAMQQSRC